MRKLISAMMALAMVLSLTACGSGDANEEQGENGTNAEETITIKLPHGYAESHPLNIALEEYFKPEVEERSGGRLTVEIYPNSILATEEQIYEGLRNNTYEMGIIGISFQDLIPSAAALQLPFLFKDFDQARTAMTEYGYGYQLAGDTESLGFKITGITGAGFRVMTLNKKVETMDDFKGLKLRMPNMANMVKIGELLGCAVTPMAMSEIFSALEQGVIDGQENPASSIRANGWYEVQDYLMVSNHVFTPLFFCVSNDFYNSLDDDLRTILDETVTETSNMVWDAMEEQTQEDLDFMASEAEIEVYEPSEELRQAMIDATLPMYTELYEVCPEVEEVVTLIREL